MIRSLRPAISTKHVVRLSIVSLLVFSSFFKASRDDPTQIFKQNNKQENSLELSSENSFKH